MNWSEKLDSGQFHLAIKNRALVLTEGPAPHDPGAPSQAMLRRMCELLMGFSLSEMPSPQQPGMGKAQ